MSEWIDWWGGDCPVPDGTRVQVRYVGDEDDAAMEEVVGDPETLRWDRQGGLGDIIAYRKVEPVATKDTNPKDAAAVGRVPMHMVPDTLVLFAAMGFAEGDSKYVAYNFRVAGVRVSVYVSALRRHLARYFNGEWADKKTKVPHLASVACCVAILIDGHVGGTINDDRPPPIDLGAEFERAEEIIARVYEMNLAVRPVGVEYRADKMGGAS
jgi:hypothetical protein